MYSVRIGVIGFAGLLVAGCAAGDRHTDREAKSVADAISYPRQNSAAGYAKAALKISRGNSPTFSVLEMRDLKAETLSDPLAHLVFRIHYEPQGSDWGDPVTACYSLDFNYYGTIGEPSRITCPDNAVAITPPALPRRFLDGSPDNAMDSVLSALPATPNEADIRDTLRKALPRSANTAAHLPEITVTVQGGTVAVSALTDDNGNQGLVCLLGTRINGVSVVWRDRANRCDAQHALETQQKPR